MSGLAPLLLGCAVGCKPSSRSSHPDPLTPSQLLARFDPDAEAQRLQGTWRSTKGCVEHFEGKVHSEWCGSDEPVVTRFRVIFPSRLAISHGGADDRGIVTTTLGYSLGPEGLRTWMSYSGVMIDGAGLVPTFSPRGLIVAGQKECLFFRALSSFEQDKGFSSTGQSTPCTWDSADGGRALTVAVPEDDERRDIRLVQLGASLVPEAAIQHLKVRD